MPEGQSVALAQGVGHVLARDDDPQQAPTNPQIERDPEHEGGLISGRVLRGTGVPADGARVRGVLVWVMREYGALAR